MSELQPPRRSIPGIISHLDRESRVLAISPDAGPTIMRNVDMVEQTSRGGVCYRIGDFSKEVFGVECVVLAGIMVACVSHFKGRLDL